MNLYRYSRFSYVLIIVFFTFNLSAQEKGLIRSKYYSINDYNASAQNWAALQDNRGVMYFANNSGVLEFDGENWKLFKVANQSSVRSLAIDSKGVVYVGAFGEMGFLQPDSVGNMHYHSLTPLIDKKYSDFREVWNVYCFSDTVFFFSDYYIFRYHDGRFSYWASKDKSFYLSYPVHNSLYILDENVGLLKFENDSLRLIKGGADFSNLQIHSIFSIGNDLLLGTRSKGFFIYEENTSTLKSIASISSNACEVNNYFKENLYYHGTTIADTLFVLSSILGDVLVVDRNWHVKDVINNESLGIRSTAFYVYFQGDHTLWLALDNGVCRVDLMSPFRFWKESMGINGIISDVARVDSVLYVATTSGVFYTGPTQNPFQLNRFNRVEGQLEQSWQFLYFQPPTRCSKYYLKNPDTQKPYESRENTILLAADLSGVYQIEKKKSKRLFAYDGVTSLHQSYSNPTKLLVGLSNGVAQLSYKKGVWTDDGMKFGIDANIIDIAEDYSRNIWISTRFSGIYRIRNPFGDSTQIMTDRFDSLSGIPCQKSVLFVDDYKPFLLYTGSEYYEFIDSLKQFKLYVFPKVNSSDEKKVLDPNTIYYRGIYRDIISREYVVNSTDDILWFCTSEGFFRYTPKSTRNFYSSPPVLIRKVLCGDSTLFYGTNIRRIDNGNFYLDTSTVVDIGTILKHKDNSVTFHYSWPSSDATDNLYSYRLLGFSDVWSEWTGEIKKDYTNLSEGEYTFSVKAKNNYGIESRSSEFTFSVLPPWYRTYWAYALYLVLSILFISLVVKLYTYKLIREKNKLEEIVKERTQEILIQNEEILVQAEHLKDANDWISAKNIELEAQKEEIEKKKNELEISDATKNKFFRIIAHDLRNPISTLVNTTSYILTDIEEFDKERTKRMIGELNRISITTYNFLENLLDWTTSQMGDLRFYPRSLNLRSLINENIELVQSKIDSKNIQLTLSVSDDINVFADENMLNTVIRNIITNAVKFTYDDGKIIISAYTEDNYCFLRIADNGVGITGENLKKLFRIDKDVVTAGTHNEKGSGLGLILSKEFIERNGGTIIVESEPQKGSAFTISLKLG
ncbi:MAG: ATP-binding protein [Bacteroidales bacterium]